MYPSAHPAVPAPQSRSVAPETFLLDQDAQQALPPEAVLALQQVDNRELLPFPHTTALSNAVALQLNTF